MENDNHLESSSIIHPIDSVMKSIFLENSISLGMDVAEIGIDSLLKTEEFKQIPIVKTVHSLAKISLAIRDRYLLKKVLVFINALNQGNAKAEEIEKRKKAANNNEKWLRKEIELLTIHLDRLDELEKVRITLAFYIEYINQRISWSQYREYLAIIERVFFQDFVQLLDIYDALLQEKKVSEYIEKGFDGGVSIKKINELNCDRLIAVGLVRAKRTSIYNSRMVVDYYLTGLGLKFAEVLYRCGKFENSG